MNKAILIGRLTRDTEMRYSQGEGSMAITRFNIAVDRKGKQDEADFINCVSFGKTAEFIDKYFSKGMKIAILGHIQTGSYEKDGHKVYTTDIVVDEAEFVEKKGSTESKEGFMNIPDNIAEELPFV